MTPRFTLTAAVLGTPDPKGLARFYQRLLGWPIRDDEPDWATLRPADGGTGLSFQLEADHVPPVWPPVPGPSRCRRTSTWRSTTSPRHPPAEEAGARLPGRYTRATRSVRIYADPAGHPFCLFVRT